MRRTWVACAVVMIIAGGEWPALGGATAPAVSPTVSSDASATSGGCGQSWQVVSPPPTPYSLTAVAWMGSQLVAVGSVGTILTSPDATTWTWHGWSPTANLAAITWTGTQLVAVGSVGTILTSSDGVTWTPHNWGTPFGLTGVVSTGTQVVAVGYGGTILTSPDGTAWTSQISGTSYPLTAVAWTGAQVVAVGQYGTIVTSPDGATWTLQSSGTGSNLFGVASTGQNLVVVGGAGTVLTSPDGITWNVQSSGVSSQLNAVAWAGTQAVAVGALGTILTSPDGVTWTEQASGTSDQLNGVGWTGTTLVAVGDFGTVLTASCPPPCSPPSVTTQPQSQTIMSGQSVTLSATATGTTPLAYQWYQGSSGDTSLPVGTNASSFTTPALTTTTSYWVQVTNACGQADSATATVSMTCTAASITTQPQSHAITSGQSVTLSAIAAGTTPLAYQWYQGSSGDTSLPVGTNASSFTTPALTTTTSYWVRVTNACGHADSATATVSVTCTAASITTQPQSQTITSGQAATLSVTATGTAPLSYQWYQGSSGDTSLPVGTNASSFTTPALTTTTSYWVRVTNTCGRADSATATVSMVGQTPPSITTQPLSQSIVRGQSVTLAVSATGVTPLTYQWYQGSSGDTSLPVGTNASSFTTPTLTTTTSYWVQVTNAYGDADSAAATLTVVSPLRRHLTR